MLVSAGNLTYFLFIPGWESVLLCGSDWRKLQAIREMGFICASEWGVFWWHGQELLQVCCEARTNHVHSNRYINLLYYIWLALWVGKMKQILCSDWLPTVYLRGQDQWSHLDWLGWPAMFLQENSKSFSFVICTKKNTFRVNQDFQVFFHQWSPKTKKIECLEENKQIIELSLASFWSYNKILYWPSLFGQDGGIGLVFFLHVYGLRLGP